MEKFERVVGAQGDLVGHDLNVWIELGNGSLCGFDFGLTNRGLTVDNLTLKVRFVHSIKIHDSQTTDACGGEIGEKGRTKAACADG